MNICGVPGKTMVNFVEPSDYMFGTQGFEDRCEQGGIYNRGYCGLRIETLPDGVTDTLDAFYQALAKRETQARTVSFRLVGARTGNILRRFLPFIDRCQEEGNCAFWTSRGLEFVGLMQRPRIFPKGIWFDLFETQSALLQRARRLLQRGGPRCQGIRWLQHSPRHRLSAAMVSQRLVLFHGAVCGRDGDGAFRNHEGRGRASGTTSTSSRLVEALPHPVHGGCCGVAVATRTHVDEPGLDCTAL